MIHDSGVPERCAVALLRTVIPHGIGFALAEVSWQSNVAANGDDIARIRRISGLLSPHASDDLVRTALLMCGDCDMDAQFDVGIDLMIHGLDAYLQNPVDSQRSK